MELSTAHQEHSKMDCRVEAASAPARRKGGYLPLRAATTRTAPATIPRVVPIVGWPRPNPIPNPVATPAVIHPAARTLGARHFANVDDPASEIGFRSADLLAAKNPIRRAGRSRLLTFWTVLPGSKLPVSAMSIRWTMVAPTPNTATAITVASRKPSRRPMAMIPRLPTARLAKPTSSDTKSKEV